MTDRRLAVLAMAPCAAEPLRTIAAELGYDSWVAPSVNGALAVLDARAGRVAVVFCQAALPDGNFSDLMEGIRRRGLEIPVVLCCPAAVAETWWDALENGVRDVMVPPFTRQGVERAIQACGRAEGARVNPEAT